MSRSDELWKEAQERLVGGVNSPVRAFKAVGGTPVWFARGDGAYLTDVDGNRYTDFLQAGGPTLLGSNHPVVRRKVNEVLDQCGPVTGLLHEYEVKLAELVCQSMPAVDMKYSDAMWVMLPLPADA